MELRLSEVVGALSHALDVTHGQPGGHAARSCLIGMRIARAVALEAAALSAERPYRGPVDAATVLEIMGRAAGRKLDATVFGALEACLPERQAPLVAA